MDEPSRIEPARFARAARWLSAAGALLATLALAAWLLGAVPDMPRRAWLVLIALGAAVFALARWHRHVPAVHAASAAMLLNTLLLLAVVEGASTLANGLHRVAAWTGGPLPMTQEPALREVARGGAVEPQFYVGWQGRPYQGETLNVDERGLRRTPAVVVPAGVRPVRIHAFGGSTMWGEGAADDQTIPAHLQQLLSAGAGVPVEVTNFGQRAWVSTQGLVRLMLELQQAAAPPDIVVFYDGYNDVYAAYSSGRTGVPENFGNMRDQMQASGLRRVLASTETYRLMQRMLARGSPSPAPDERMTAMAQHVVQTYLRNHAMAQALGQPHRSDVWFFWQPQLMMGAKPLTPQEDAIARSHPWLAPDVKVLTRAAYAHLAAALPRQGMVDLSDALDGTRDLAYLDPCHLNGIGNRAVAQAMADRGLLAAVRRAAERRRNGG